MNWNRVRGTWKQVTGRAKEQWGKLIRDDLVVAAGRRDQLLGKIRELYGVAKDDAQRRHAQPELKANAAAEK